MPAGRFTAIAAWLSCALLAVGFPALDAKAKDGLPPNAPGVTFITLGTRGGPLPDAKRSQPANVLLADGHAILIDVGDGTDQRLAAAGIPLGQVRAIVISHLHFDHTGGLYAFLGQRLQTMTPGVVTIYGPPGVRDVVHDLVAAIRRSVADAGTPDPDQGIQVIELDDGRSFDIGTIRGTAVANTHYSVTPQPQGVPRQVSLSYRFDAPGRSVVYTGDTGPSAAVERLAKGADLLVSEIIAPDISMKAFRHFNPGASQDVLSHVEAHFRNEHLSPADVGKLARKAGAKALVLTHLGLPDSAIPSATRSIASEFAGSITFAHDLDRF